MASLIKWAGWIAHTPVEVVTDHKSLESWVREYVETPSGPTGRKARWHEVFSQFNLVITYQPGSTNTVADAMSRWAYPASTERQDVSVHGSAKSAGEVARMREEEMKADRAELPWGRVGMATGVEDYTLKLCMRKWALQGLGSWKMKS